jgi:serine/threonine-protein kinase
VLGKKRRKSSRKRAEVSAAGKPADAPDQADAPEERAASEGTITRIGRYTIESELGQGGMGKVYLARDPVIGRNVALKVITIRPDLSEEDARQYRERFLREAQAAGALIHPNIVSVHDIGQDAASGCPYIVMEHVPGRDLKKVILSRAPLQPEEAVGVVVQIAQALDYAHRRGIVHRDIKPANILITDQGKVKITDFGVARLPGSDLTRSDQFVGSPGFMSPEQLKGAPVDGRADLFSLGVILYELLTGKAPFEGETVSEVLYRITTQPAEPPSEAHPNVSPDFDRVLEKALAKDPASRFQTGNEMIAVLAPLGGLQIDPVEEAAPAGDGTEVRSEDAASPEADELDAVVPLTPSPWFTLTSQWRLGALVGVLVLALVGVNMAISQLFRGPLGRAVQSQEEQAPPSGRVVVHRSPRGVVSIAGTSVPPPPGRSPSGASSPSGSLEGARGGIEAARAAADEGGQDAIHSDRPIQAVCAMTYAGPVEIAHAIEAARHPRPGSVRSSRPVERPNGRLRVEVKHKMRSGRLLVLVDGKTVLSKPFDATKGKSGTVTHVLSVPAGRHGVEVRLLADKGQIASRSKITGVVKQNEIALLKGEQPNASRKELELDWKVPH